MKDNREITDEEGIAKRNFDESKGGFWFYLPIVIFHFSMYAWLKISIPNIPLVQHLSYLTVISFFLNLIYYSWVLLLNSRYQNYFENYSGLNYFFRLIYSLSLVVMIMYWGLVIFNPDGIYKAKKSLMPFALDLFMHGGNYFLNLFHYLFVYNKTNVKKFSNYLTIGIFFVIYSTWIRVLYLTIDIIVYPFVAKSLMTYLTVITFASFFALFADFTFYLLANGVRGKIRSMVKLIINIEN
jgi:hypothetical protein